MPSTEQLGDQLAAVTLKDATSAGHLRVAVHYRGVIESPINGKPCHGFTGTAEAVTARTLPDGETIAFSWMHGSTADHEEHGDDPQALRATATELAWQMLDDLHGAGNDPDEWWAMAVEGLTDRHGNATIATTEGRSKAREVLDMLDFAGRHLGLVEQHADAIRVKVHGDES